MGGIHFFHLLLVFTLLSLERASAKDASAAKIEFEIIKPKKPPTEDGRRPAFQPCNEVMPGLGRLRRGVDIAKLDLFSLQPLSGDDGFRKPIVDYKCIEGKKIRVRVPGGATTMYDLPDEIWDVTALPGGFLSEQVEIFKSSKAVQKSMAVKAGASLIIRTKTPKQCSFAVSLLFKIYARKLDGE